MFCPNCGKELPEGAAFCNGCGAPQAQAPAPAAPAAPVYAPAPETPAYAPAPEAPAYAPVYAAPAPKQSLMDKLGKKGLAIVIGAAAAVVALIVILVVVFGGGGGASSPEKAAENFVVATAKGDAKGVLNSMPSFMVDYAMEMAGYDEDERDDFIDDMQDELEDEADEMESFKFKRAEVVEMLDSDEVEELREDLMDYMDMTEREANKLTAACEVEVTCRVDGETEELTLNLIKYGGKWYVVTSL